MKTFVLVRHEQIDMIANFIKALPFDGKWKVEIKRNIGKRSAAQNRLYWAWLGVIGGELGYRTDEMHSLMRFEFLHPVQIEVMGKVLEELPSTKDLNVSDFTAYLNHIELWAADMDIRLPHPEDAYYEAMGVKR